MKTRVVIGGVLLSVGILSVGVQSTIAQERTLVASGTTDSESSGTSSGSGASSSGTDSTPGTDSNSNGNSSSGSGSSADSSSSSDSGTSSGSTGGSSDSSTGSSSSSTSTSLKDGSYTGTAVATRYGNVQVQVTVAGGKMTAVTALQLTDDDGRSVQISAQAAPVLQQEALTAQSANIDTVSGATYTSGGYIQSLQSALDQAQ